MTSDHCLTTSDHQWPPLTTVWPPVTTDQWPRVKEKLHFKDNGRQKLCFAQDRDKKVQERTSVTPSWQGVGSFIQVYTLADAWFDQKLNYKFQKLRRLANNLTQEAVSGQAWKCLNSWWKQLPVLIIYTWIEYHWITPWSKCKLVHSLKDTSFYMKKDKILIHMLQSPTNWLAWGCESISLLHVMITNIFFITTSVSHGARGDLF